MKDLIAIKVECKAGYKADEYPVLFYWDNLGFEIDEILDRWYQGEQNPAFPVANYFKVRTPDKKTYILKHETKTDKWYLLVKGETLSL
ncbi:cytoplasmic protein [Draconibacterium orientale]|uniref:cytoplasmic protein n=1 Tax=Draconibacterium orientale TaxID=1168034 RepID=UPI002A0A769E|nr:cytoplasmic protein [Draconibacterium orientale]